MKHYFLIRVSINEYNSAYKKICETYEEAVSQVNNFADWFCDYGTCDIEEVDSDFKTIKTYVFWKGELIRTY